jgi:predicted ATPase/class 3 adenylate cyclase
MPELPSGTVTLLFTDIEGSTRLLERLGSEYEQVLAEHRRLIREAVSAQGGVEVDTQGDAFLCAFTRASDAVEAAAEAQRSLAGTPVRVRIGIHTGEPTRTPEGYVGVDLHRGARFCSAAHGGQVLLSQTTRDLLSDLSVRDLGQHRLKDLSEPQRLFQLSAEGLESEFPPPRTLENRPTNLPVQPTPLVGRERELEEVLSILERADVRLLTLTGPGGTGKTRLALQAGAELVEHYPDGVWFVNLAALTDPALVVPTIAQTLAVKEQPGEELQATLARELEPKQLLLLLDNFEQVAEAAPELSRVLAQAASVSAIVTSRASLHLSGEHEYAVPPLAGEEAVALFAERAQAVKASFHLDGNRPIVSEICRRLDQLPLAIELAAARIKLLPEQALLERLDQKLKLLTGGARDLEERQRTLRAAIDWSYTLLSQEEQVLFRRLSVFAGGRTLEAIEAVCDPDATLDVFEGIASLVDKSLLRQEETDEGEARFVMLETIHEYAREKLEEAGEAEELRRRHAEYFAAYAEEHGSSQAIDYLDSIRLEHDNLRAALSWLRIAGAAGQELRFVSALATFWTVEGLFSEGRTALESALSRSETISAPERIKALRGLSKLAYYQADYEAARACSEEVVQLARRGSDRAALAMSLNDFGVDLVARGETERAIELYQEASLVAEEEGLQAVPKANMGYAKLVAGDADGAARDLGDLLNAIENTGGDTLFLSNVLFNLGLAELETGAADDAEAQFRRSLSLSRRLGHKFGISYGLTGIAAVRARRDEPEAAGRLMGAADAVVESIDAGFEPYEARIRERALNEIRVQLGDGKTERVLAEGRAMSLDEAVDFALGDHA